MSFVVGNRVRFSATFKDADRIPFDPVAIAVTVTSGGKQRRFSRVGGDVHRVALGRYYIELMVDTPGELDIKWASTGAGQEAWQRAQYQIVADERDVELPTTIEGASGHTLSDELSDEVVFALDAAKQRARMIADLEASGMRVDATKSDAYIEAAHRALGPRRESARDLYVRKRRFGD